MFAALLKAYMGSDLACRPATQTPRGGQGCHSDRKLEGPVWGPGDLMATSAPPAVRGWKLRGKN